MTDSDDVSTFLESWQATLQEAAISGCTFSEAQQVNLLLGALPDSWSAFVTTQGGIADFTFTNLLSNILQHDSTNMSKNEQPKNNAFYVKANFRKQDQFSQHNLSFENHIRVIPPQIRLILHKLLFVITAANLDIKLLIVKRNNVI